MRDELSDREEECIPGVGDLNEDDNSFKKAMEQIEIERNNLRNWTKDSGFSRKLSSK